MFRPVFQREDALFIGQNTKYDYDRAEMVRHRSKRNNCSTPCWRTTSHRSQEGRRRHGPASAPYLQYAPVSIETLIGKKRQGSRQDAPMWK